MSPCRKEKSNYRPASILSNVSKVYERCLYNEIYHFFFFLNVFRYQCGFRKGFNNQNTLTSMVEKILLARDKKDVSGTILTD